MAMAATATATTTAATATATAATPLLHTCKVQQPRANFNRIHTFFHFTAILALLYYRFSSLLHGKNLPLFSWTLLTFSELIFTLVWAFTQAFRWRPVVRSVKPENLPGDLPGVDVFICTADPSKEPVVEVMNTVISAMALDYPPEKLSVYLSDDGAAAATLYAMKEACGFARRWLPFCRRFGVKTMCPDAFFNSLGDHERFLRFGDDEFIEEELKLKLEYDVFKRNVEKAVSIDSSVKNDRPSYVEVIHDNTKNDDEESKMPLLVYVSRERRPSRSHRFKAGALNALLRVSGLMSNAPYMIVLDCDMYCNDPSSAKQAMCFHLDPNFSKDLSYVQYPQIFYNVSKNDIYDGQARSAYTTKYQGMDGIRGTICAGTGYYLNKKALFSRPNQDEELLHEAENRFGCSSMFIDSLKRLNDQSCNKKNILSDSTIEEAKNVASCTYEENTEWGNQIGYSYECLLESSFTSYLVHCKGWRSVYLYPKRPCFLGCTTIDMKDALIQLMKWASGLVQVGFSKYSPFVYGISNNMPILQALCYGYFMFCHLLSIPSLLYGIVPQLCFLTGTPLFPKVSSIWFAPFAVVFVSSLLQHFYEVFSTGGSIMTLWNEQRFWLIRSVTACLFGCVDALLKQIGVAKANFRLTNKAIDEDKLRKYEKGEFDFQGAKMFMVPLTLSVVLNFVSFVFGMKRMVREGNYGEMFGQCFLSSYVLALSLPILKGLVIRKGKKN